MNFEIRILVGVSAEHNILPTVSCKKKKNNSFFLLKDSFYLYCCFFVLNQATTPMKSVSHCLVRDILCLWQCSLCSSLHQRLLMG